MHWIAHRNSCPSMTFLSTFAHDNRIYAFGGNPFDRSGLYRPHSRIEVHVLRTDTMRWSELRPPAAAAAAAATDVWPYMPPHSSTGIAHGHSVYLFASNGSSLYGGAYAAGDPTGHTLFRFDMLTHTWSQPPVGGAVPAHFIGQSACTDGEHLYTFGGLTADRLQLTDAVHRLHLGTLRWSPVATANEPRVRRTRHTATVLAHRMYVFGGVEAHTADAARCSRHTECLDLRTLRWHSLTDGDAGDGDGDGGVSTPGGRYGHTAFVHGGRLIVYGGYNADCTAGYGGLHAFDPATGVWSAQRTHGVRPSVSARQSGLMVGNRMYVFGGLR